MSAACPLGDNLGNAGGNLRYLGQRENEDHCEMHIRRPAKFAKLVIAIASGEVEVAGPTLRWPAGVVNPRGC